MKCLPLLLAAVPALLLLTGCDKILYGENTDFASGYSERGFRRVKQGMTTQQVLASLGHPLSKSTQEWSEVWSYWPNGEQPSVSKAKDATSTYNLFGKVTHLRFSRTATVTGASGNYLDGNLLGLTKDQVLSTFGEPSRREVRQFEIIYHYAAAGKSGSGSYRRREVHFDASGAVISVVAQTYYD
jgi:outer membrane protein assembly factor BamE (lipoprotein component of BamABCDE complex)